MWRSKASQHSMVVSLVNVSNDLQPLGIDKCGGCQDFAFSDSLLLFLRKLNCHSKLQASIAEQHLMAILYIH